jgi:uncharacterized protein YlaN (UPF0358 family)
MRCSVPNSPASSVRVLLAEVLDPQRLQEHRQRQLAVRLDLVDEVLRALLAQALELRQVARAQL